MIPLVPESWFGGYNWYLSAIRLGRISSRAYSSLFSVSASLKSKESSRASLHSIRRLLEDWRQDIPLEFRPEEPIQLEVDASPSRKLVFLQTQYNYYNILIALDRLTIQVDQGTPSIEETRHRLMQSARTIIELTIYIDARAFVSIG